MTAFMEDWKKKQEITVEELAELSSDEVYLVDIRDEVAFERGSLPGAQNLNPLELQQGGYSLWLQRKLERETAEAAEDSERLKRIENSLRKKYKHKISTKFVVAVSKFELVRPGDKIAVCISGGKDSMLMAKLFQDLKRHNKFPFELVFLCMDPGYNEMNRRIIEENAKLLHVPLTFFSTDIFE